MIQPGQLQAFLNIVGNAQAPRKPVKQKNIAAPAPMMDENGKPLRIDHFGELRRKQRKYEAMYMEAVYGRGRGLRVPYRRR